MLKTIAQLSPELKMFTQSLDLPLNQAQQPTILVTCNCLDTIQRHFLW
jgi:hypothetical protein